MFSGWDSSLAVKTQKTGSSVATGNEAALELS